MATSIINRVAIKSSTLKRLNRFARDVSEQLEHGSFKIQFNGGYSTTNISKIVRVSPSIGEMMRKRGIETMKFKLLAGKVTGSEYSDVIRVITNIAKGIMKDYKSIKVGNIMVGAKPNKLGFEKSDIFYNIISNIPSKNYLSKNYWRGKLADIVMSDKDLVSKFGDLTRLMLILEKDDIYARLKEIGDTKEINDENKRFYSKFASLFFFMSKYNNSPNSKNIINFLISEKKRTFFQNCLRGMFPKDSRDKLPPLLRKGLSLAKVSSRLTYYSYMQSMKQAAKLFIGGEDMDQAKTVMKGLEKHNIGTIPDFVAEEAETEDIARKNLHNYLGAIKTLEKGSTISIKFSGLCPEFNKLLSADRSDPSYPELLSTIREKSFSFLDQLMEGTKSKDSLVVIDMERHAQKDVTYDIYMGYLKERNYEYANNLGIVLQTYLSSSLEDTQKLSGFAKECSTNKPDSKLFVRFVKGAYQKKDSLFVLQNHENVNKRYIDCLNIAFEARDNFRFAIASHNIRTITESIALAKEWGMQKSELEFEMLNGMPASPILYGLAKSGYRTRFYLPIGDFKDSMGYFLRRMTENASGTSCNKFFKMYYDGKISYAEYVRNAFKPADLNLWIV